ncbi:hypothetical protein AXG93_3786s1100 [Marchantia polymorpha subsp. ruderalis]|uniref:Uncharacterized protein n=1 Tax=Marchantia polymorpha subsp. ruderalis TaxID=1480154 RepID=A0A176W103_MARPO|nr:hypothetical protein AXG93_3786s1100 [Marchantia polymorpha subsp. ruderalis]
MPECREMRKGSDRLGGPSGKYQKYSKSGSRRKESGGDGGDGGEWKERREGGREEGRKEVWGSVGGQEGEEEGLCERSRWGEPSGRNRNQGPGLIDGWASSSTTTSTSPERCAEIRLGLPSLVRILGNLLEDVGSGTRPDRCLLLLPPRSTEADCSEAHVES